MYKSGIFLALMTAKRPGAAFVASSHAFKGNHVHDSEVEVVIDAHAHGAQIPMPPEYLTLALVAKPWHG